MPRTDDTRIGNDVALWRAVPESQITEKPGGKRPASWAFRDLENNEVFVYIASETDLPWLRRKFPGWVIVEVTAGEARACNYIVTRDPQPGEDSHAVMSQKAEGNKGKTANARRLAELARFLPE